MRILFMGTPDIAADCLKALYEAGHDICGVYTRRDKPVGRKQVLTAPPVKEVALAHGTPVFQPRTLLHNMIVGVTEGFKKELDVNGVGYRVAKEGNKLVKIGRASCRERVCQYV